MVQNKDLARHIKTLFIIGAVQIAVMCLVLVLTNIYCKRIKDNCAYQLSAAEALSDLDKNVSLALIDGNSVDLSKNIEKDLFSIQESGKDMTLFRSSLQEYLSEPNRTKYGMVEDQIHALTAEIKKQENKREEKADLLEHMISIIGIALLIGSAYLMVLNIALIRRFSLEEKVKEEKKSCKDSLTGLWNRRFVDQYLKKEVEEKQTGYLFMTDMDYFKKVNDTMGHDKGDEALILVAEAILSVVRKEDRVCRLGGDEYMIYLPGETTEEGAKMVVERFKTAMRQKFDPTDMSFVTLSCGATKIDGTCSFEEAYKQADDALRFVKEHGKNGFYIAKKAVEKDEK